MEDGSLVRRLPASAKLLHDLDPDPGVVGDLVPDANPLHRRGKSDRIVLAEEAGIELPEPSRDLD